MTFAEQINAAAKHAHSAGNILDTSLTLDLRQLAVVENLFFARAQAAQALAAIEWVIEQRQTSATPEPCDENERDNFVHETTLALRQCLTLRRVR